MEAKVMFVCLFICLSFCGVWGQVGSLCRPNERLLPCGCPRSCRDPVPDCKGVCQTGCFCEEGELRNDTGHCVKLADCPSISSHQDTSEPRVNGGICPEGEEYRFCEPCNRSCGNPNPICPAQCSRGCFCKGDLLRDVDGRCVQWIKCSNILKLIEEREKASFEPPARYSCGRHQTYKQCEKCTRTCGAEPVCGSECRAGCFCKDGYVKGPRGCVRGEECPENL